MRFGKGLPTIMPRVRPKSGPEARFPGRKHYCITSGAYKDHGIDIDIHCPAVFKDVFYLFLSPIPLGVPREGPDCRFP